MKRAILLSVSALALVPGVALSNLRSTPDLGTANARCRLNEGGPALVVDVTGLKDRQGVLKLEVYPANDDDFLEDDNRLVEAGKVFRRVVQPLSAEGGTEMCVRVPRPGTYAVSILHDRNANRKFDLSKDGIGFTGNPRLGLFKPKARDVSISIGNGVTHAGVTMNYRRSLFSFAPLKQK